jgi:hypothetical protein
MSPLDAPEPTIVDGEFVPSRDLPFSDSLDLMIAEIRAGNAPNLGRFCGYCYTPLDAKRRACPTCETRIDDVPPREKIARTVAQVYTAKRKREGRYVHGAAWAGILFGAAVSVGLIAVLPGWTKVFAILFLIAGSYYIASYLGNVAVQNYAYRRGLQQFSVAWQEFLALRDDRATDED